MPIGFLLLLVLWILLTLGAGIQVFMSAKDADLRVFWLLFLLLFPFVSVVLYCVFGISYNNPAIRERLHRRARALFSREMTPECLDSYFQNRDWEQVEAPFRPLAKLLDGMGEYNPVSAGNHFEIITSGLRKRELLLEQISRARRFIHLEYFRFGNDKAGREVRDLLMQKVREGVEVRFLCNNLSNWRTIPRSYYREMEEAGVEVMPFTHIRHGFRKWLMRINRQNHRKLVIIDGHLAFTGGMNLNDNYFYKWRDTHLMVSGPVVASMQASFADSWVESGGTFKQPLPYYFRQDAPAPECPFRNKLMQVVTDAPENAHPATLMAYEWNLQNAQHYVYIQTPYFLPPESLLHALKGAALRGVDVRLMLPSRVDTLFAGPGNRSYYTECMEAGIRIIERGGEFIHAKTLVADDGVSIIGASNLDYRSFEINYELNTLVYDRECALACKEIFLEEAAGYGRELDGEAWRRSQTLWERVKEQWVRMLRREL